ncbi:MAG: hypothetical protein KBD21_03305 [Candidatus Pacebacteria bacterium]|nr:hypothetical protein [Candidatus Paceibacterota bacterium]
MIHTHVFIFGNPDLVMDSLPVRLLPRLRETFPDISFETLDPNEEWDVPAHMLIIDTVVNISELTVFRDLGVFMAAPRMTCHDFDAYANLMLMKKLGKVTDATIIGLPPDMHEDGAFSELCTALTVELKKEY